MGLKMFGLLAISLFVCGIAASGATQKTTTLVAGGTEMVVGMWTFSDGSQVPFPPAPGAKVRGWVAPFVDTLVGPAGDLASGAGPVTMNCNLDETATGPCWGTFEFQNTKGAWVGTWQGTFNFVTGAGSYHAVGHGQGGLKGMVIENDAVYPGWHFGMTPPTGYVYSTVKSVNAE
jgi:hypothetical protein